MDQPRSVIVGSARSAPPGVATGDVDLQAITQVSLYLKATRAGQGSSPGGAYRGRAELRAERETSLAEPIARVRRFAEQEGLQVVEVDAGRRLVKLEGRLERLQAVFGTQLAQYEHEGRSFRARSGGLTAPTEVADGIEAVLGLDQRPIATPKLMWLADPAATPGFLPNRVAELYDFPSPPGSGAGECIAILELGGGFNASDTQAAFRAMGLTAPKVVAVPVSGGANAPGQDTDADGEVALDIQVAGGGAPGAILAVYFAANTDQGFVDAVSQAAHDETNKPTILSISWGSPESEWTQQAVAAMTSAFQDAADLGLSVFAASGDGLATDGVKDGKAHVDFPASSPLVVGCGGTHIDVSNNAITGESVWNSDGGGSGGGISALFPVPTYQHDVTLPPSVNGAAPGRGVPDVASDADPNSGFRVVVDGAQQVIGGTSAAAPLWAGLFALINAAAGRPSGQPHALLYANTGAFRDTVSGDNKAGGIGYDAGKGWDACTGLGSPQGAKIAALFHSAAHAG
jgi:kumamolisin